MNVKSWNTIHLKTFFSVSSLYAFSYGRSGNIRMICCNMMGGRKDERNRRGENKKKGNQMESGMQEGAVRVSASRSDVIPIGDNCYKSGPHNWTVTGGVAS
jgi:hypothetical protein